MWSYFLTCLVAVTATLQGVEGQYHSLYERRHSAYPRQPVRSYQIHTSGSSLSFVGSPVDSENGGHVHLDIYYETNCPDSMRFITRQLYPLYQEMKDIVKFRLIPFGKATASYNEVSNQYDFNCHHGPPECYGNTVQSCVISMYPSPEEHLNYVNCMEAYPRPSSSAEKCARRQSLDWKKISKCAEGDEGNRLLYENAQLTTSLDPNLNFVPWIVVNKVYTPEQQRKALRDLKRVVCDHNKNRHPKCSRFS